MHCSPQLMETVTTICVVTVSTTWHVITVHRRCSSVGPVTWRCHIVVVVGVYNGGRRRSNDVCRGWLLVAVEVGGRRGWWRKKNLFVNDVHVMLPANAAHAAQ